MVAHHTILVVEDNDFVRMQICTFLRDSGYIALEATDGDKALDVVAKEKGIDLAVVDMRMEPMGGFEFIGMLKVQGHTLPVILITGDQDNTTLEEAQKLGVAGVFMKPIQKDRLVSMVGRLIERK